MASAAQISANQTKAQASTGPRTEEGKARVSQNAHHATDSPPPLVIRDRPQPATAGIRHTPRLPPLRTRPPGRRRNRHLPRTPPRRLESPPLPRHRSRNLLARFLRLPDPQATAVLDRISRYQARTQRAYYKALAELRVLQTNRALRLAKLAAEDESQVPAITDINHLTKQTHSEVMAEAITQALTMVEYESQSLTLNHLKNRPALSPKPGLKPAA